MPNKDKDSKVEEYFSRLRAQSSQLSIPGTGSDSSSSGATSGLGSVSDVDDIKRALDTIQSKFSVISDSYSVRIEKAEESFRADLDEVKNKHIKELADMKESHRVEIDELEKLIARHREDADSAEKKLADERMLINDELSRIRAETSRQLDELEQVVAEFKAKSDEKDIRIAELEAALEDARRKNDELGSSHAADSAVLLETRTSYENTIKGLKSQLDQLRIEKSRLELTYSELVVKADNLEDSNNASLEELRMAHDEIDFLKVKVSELMTCQKCDAFKNEIALKDAELTLQKETLASSKKTYEEDIENKNMVYRELESRYNDLDKVVSDLHGKLDVMSKEYDRDRKKYMKMDIVNAKMSEKYQSIRKLKPGESLSDDHKTILDLLLRIKDLLAEVPEKDAVCGILDAIEASLSRMVSVFEEGKEEVVKYKKVADESLKLSEENIRKSKELIPIVVRSEEVEAELKAAKNECVKRAQSLLEMESRLTVEKIKSQEISDRLKETEERVSRLEEEKSILQEAIDESAKTTAIAPKSEVSAGVAAPSNFREKFDFRSIDALYSVSGISGGTKLDSLSPMSKLRVVEFGAWEILQTNKYSDNQAKIFLERAEESLPVHLAAGIRVKLNMSKADAEVKSVKSFLDKLLVCAVCNYPPMAILPPKFSSDYKTAQVTLEVAVRMKNITLTKDVLSGNSPFTGVLSRRDDLMTVAFMASNDLEFNKQILGDEKLSKDKVDKMFIRAVSSDNAAMFNLLVLHGLEVSQAQITHITKSHANKIFASLIDIVPDISDNATYLTENLPQSAKLVVAFVSKYKDNASKVPASLIVRAIELEDFEVLRAMETMINERFTEVYIDYCMHI